MVNLVQQILVIARFYWHVVHRNIACVKVVYFGMELIAVITLIIYLFSPFYINSITNLIFKKYQNLAIHLVVQIHSLVILAKDSFVIQLQNFACEYIALLKKTRISRLNSLYLKRIQFTIETNLLYLSKLNITINRILIRRQGSYMVSTESQKINCMSLLYKNSRTFFFKLHTKYVLWLIYRYS